MDTRRTKRPRQSTEDSALSVKTEPSPLRMVPPAPLQRACHSGSVSGNSVQTKLDKQAWIDLMRKPKSRSLAKVMRIDC